jgi:2-phosphoglycerate kinase
MADALLPGGLPAEVAPELAEPIRIADGGTDVPFSKGILSQSLLAAAIEPGDAFDAAREIELELRRLGTLEIDRKSLRRLTYEIVSASLGAAVGERYLVWRRFQDPERPVILLLGGPTGAGKTALAVEVAHRLGIARVISTDSIRQIMRIMLSAELAPALHVSSYEAWREVPDATEPDDAAVVAGFRDQAQVVAVGVRGLVERAISENTSLVLDGVSLVPGLMGLDVYRDRADVIMMIVANLDPESYRERFQGRRRGPGHAEHDYLENLDRILAIQDHFLEIAEERDVPIVDNEDFDQSVLNIIRYVVETLRDRHGFDASELV